LNEIKREVEELYEKHLSGNLSADDIHYSAFYNDFDDTCIEWGEIDREDIDWTEFWTGTLYHVSGWKHQLEMLISSPNKIYSDMASSVNALSLQT